MKCTDQEFAVITRRVIIVWLLRLADCRNMFAASLADERGWQCTRP